jgi:translation elongation factor EF-1beta
MALFIGAGAAAACGLGIVNCTRETSYPTVEVDQCEEMDKQLKEEYGDDYKTNRETFPITAFGLQYIKSTGCTQQFDYEALADEFCQSLGNYTEQIGGGETCEGRDQTNVLRSQWCLNTDSEEKTVSNGITIGPDAENRMKSDGRCSKEKLSTKYDETWEKYCKAKPDDHHCICYNMKNNVCDTNPDAAGCRYYEILEENKEAFSTKEERDALEEGEEVASYTVLKTKGHCRPRSCESGYIPTNVKSDCAATYPICGKDIDIRTHSNSQIAVKCNYDPNRVRTFPDWWTEERDSSFMDRALDRQPPFDKWPLNLLPITRFPKRFRWRDKNVRYLTYGGVGSVSLCSLCMIVIMLVFSGSKRR